MSSEHRKYLSLVVIAEIDLKCLFCGARFWAPDRQLWANKTLETCYTLIYLNTEYVKLFSTRKCKMIFYETETGASQIFLSAKGLFAYKYEYAGWISKMQYSECRRIYVAVNICFEIMMRVTFLWYCNFGARIILVTSCSAVALSKSKSRILEKYSQSVNQTSKL